MWSAEELLSLLREATEQETEEGQTAAEIAEVWDVCDQVARKRIRELMAAGKMRNVRVVRTQMDGVTKRVSGYAPMAGNSAAAGRNGDTGA
jgi:Mg2+/Co2+ transporter CorC